MRRGRITQRDRVHLFWYADDEAARISERAFGGFGPSERVLAAGEGYIKLAKFTLEQLRSMSNAERANLYKNAVKLGTPEAKVIIDQMIKHNLLVTDTGGFPQDHPVIIRIDEIVRSDEGRAAARQAADSGRPALEGVDPLLQNDLGGEYGPFDTTNWAGFFVADEMRKAGYKQMPGRSLKEGCVAKTGAFFQKS